jgi:hypothetical protein
MAVRGRRVLVLLLALILVVFATSTQVSIFVIQPIGAIPEGRTIVISRMSNTRFIDSADAVCMHVQGGVNLICGAAILGAIGREAYLYARLPYSQTLCLWSTGGTADST